MPSRQLELLFLGISSRFPLAKHFDLPGSQSIYGISQNPPMCAHAFLSQDGFYQRGLWVEHLLTSLTFDPQGAFLCMCGREGLLVSRIKNIRSGQGPASSLNCSAVFILEFWFTGSESLIALAWELGVGFYLWPQLYSPFLIGGRFLEDFTL